ncbi:Sugar transferase involved in LPS biosynthesis (colanic, teichoic acid) [Roseibaca calidilacus]|uniref:Sugar transferase involved in LPS biosynthesis (Colanic, teichoic acid) n=2 Tax=Roseibaca calidilacus TaxID=1666912 RepID=A0ABP2BZC6_9RHOB|nr:Sugar transferase involved in LPS biosynthesis (colanic, teichoic acid) [Roseibaca calidilacus]
MRPECQVTCVRLVRVNTMTITFQHKKMEATEVVAKDSYDQLGSSAGFYARYGKRALDLAIVLPSLPIIIPIVLLCALANLASRNPVFYTQLRLGQHGRVFRIWKLSTMRPNAEKMLQDLLANDPALAREWETTQKLKDDPRVTRLGDFLRRTSLDEIPQLFNVLKGDMSLLGPRPMMLNQIELYGPTLDIYLSMKPGISGKWQVSERNNVHFRRRAQIDAEYASELSLASDLKLVWETIRTLIRSTGY